MTLAGVHVRTIGAGIIDGEVSCVAVSADLIAAGTYEGKVFLFDFASGELLRSIGEEGEAEGELTSCFGIRFTPDGGHVLIAEFSNNRLSLFTSTTGAFVRCVGVGTLACPCDVDFASNGDIVVAEYNSCRICVFSPDGSTLERSFGSECDDDTSDAPGQLKSPTALALHVCRLYVLDERSERLQVFM